MANQPLVDSGAEVFLVGVMINVIKDLNRVDHKSFSPISQNCRPIVIVTINGTMTTTGRARPAEEVDFSSAPVNPTAGNAPDSGVIRLIRGLRSRNQFA